MKLRESCLSSGWYPRDGEKIKDFLLPFAMAAAPSAKAVVAPHAGWYYSGAVAAKAVSSLAREADTIAIIGGHLPGGIPVLSAEEDGVKTPFGIMKIDEKLRLEFYKQVECASDRYEDNTVEVLLPMVHYFFPEAELLWLRFPSEISSFEAGKMLNKAALNAGRRILVISSTDLTHYGRNYGFCPKGYGRDALDWVEKTNDAAFINAILEKKAELVLERAEKDHSACSAGAVLGGLGFIGLQEQSPKLLEYRTSAGAESEIPDSFVGYAAILLG